MSSQIKKQSKQLKTKKESTDLRQDQLIKKTKTGEFLRDFVLLFDVLKVFKPKEQLSLSQKVFNTLLGLIILLVLQLIPYFGLYYISRESYMTLISSSNRSMVSLAKNAIMLAPLAVSFFISTLKVRLRHDKQRQQLIRGLRNLQILVGCLIRYTYMILFKQMDSVFILLFEQKDFLFVFLVYTLENLVASIAVVWAEQFLQNYGVSNKFAFSYFQATELLIQLYNTPYPGNFRVINIIYGVLILNFAISVDKVYLERFRVKHVMISGSTRNIDLKPSGILSNAVFAYSVLKSTVYNFLDIVVNPLLRVTQFYVFKIDLEAQYLVPKVVFEYPFFTQNYYYVLELQTWYNRYVRDVLISLALDHLVFLPLFITYCGKYNPEYDVGFTLYRLKKSNVKIENVFNQQQHIQTRISSLIRTCLFLGPLMQLIFSFIPLYGFGFKASSLVYFYGRMESILDSIKETPDKELPPTVKVLKHLI